jgi:hypothetical protein
MWIGCVRRNALLACEESSAASDRVDLDPGQTECIAYKDTDVWCRAFDVVKAVLATREHLDSSKN